MPSFLKNTAGGKAISGGALQPRGRRGNTAQIASYWAGGVDDTAFESIATTTVGAGGVATVTFSSIPSTYKHLQLRYLARTNRALVSDNLLIRFNGDTTAAYSLHQLSADGSTVYAYGSSSFETGILVSIVAAATASANVFGAGVFDILDYANTNKNKTVRDLSGIDSNGSGSVAIGSSFWSNASAITSITIAPRIGTSINQYSSFALYGIKG